MKKNLTFLLVILVGLFIFPFTTYAEEKTTIKHNINELQEVIMDDVSITNIKFNNYENTSTLAYGLSGTITNRTDYQQSVSIWVTYYDLNNNEISSNMISRTLKPKETSTYLQMSNTSYLPEEYKASDILYYEIKISTKQRPAPIISYEKPSDDPLNSYREYIIDSYDIKIKVNENNTFDIEEKIVAYFYISKHGIFRKIPVRNEVERLDGTTTKNRAKVSNLKVSHEYTTSRSSDTYEVKIGSPDLTLRGSQEYTISYTYNIGKDPMEDYDEFYFNLIGPEWDTIIGNVTFTIEMPKEFDAAKLGFSSGTKGSLANDNILYEVNDNKISGKYNGALDAGEALTVRVELEEGYFVGAGFNNEPGYIALFLIPLVCLLITIIIWAKFGNDDDIVETIEFYPPQGINSLRAGFLFKGKAESEDVVSLLIYLANKGYLKIEETNRKNKFGDKGFKITKLKEYDGTDENEKLFYEGLFKKKRYSYRKALGKPELEEYKETVTSSDLYNSFYRTMNKIIDKTNEKSNLHEIYEKGSLNKKVFIIILLIISLFTTISIPTYDFGGVEMIIASVFIIGFYIPFYVALGTAKMQIVAKIFVMGFLIFHSSMFMIALPITQAVFEEPMYLLSTVYGIACVVGMIVTYTYMPKRTPYGNEMLGKLKGFKTFLETAEKERLEAMVMQNPNYFYDILPYTYVLGISDKWIKQFEEIGLTEPDWYDGTDHFSPKSFGKFMDQTMTSAKSSMSSSPSSSGGGGGGGSSGGGSSGGGSGGGGGGSW
ncbi:MAG: DUF2207 domain-containing protein [Bacilli bacterium]|nr:DUF2207 domain-containing protein [Bacilli bacterium]